MDVTEFEDRKKQIVEKWDCSDMLNVSFFISDMEDLFKEWNADEEEGA